MALVFITGSSDGLGRAAAQSLLGGGHQVVLHARSAERAASIGEVASRASGIVVGDLRSAAQINSIADQVNAIGRMDAIIHNAGIYTERSRGSTPEGHAGVIAVNILAPYMLTALIDVLLGWSTSAAACIAAARVRWPTSTGRSGPGIPGRPTPRASYRSSRWHSQWRGAGLRS